MEMKELIVYVDAYWHKAIQLWPALMSKPMPQVVINPRLRTTAGRAFFDRNMVDFNKSLMETNKEYFIQDTIPHELAHIIAFVLFGDDGHGADWRRVLEALTGRPAERLHSMDVSAQRRKSKTYTMYCGCGPVEISPQRMAWVNKGRQYTCNNCGQLLRKEQK